MDHEVRSRRLSSCFQRQNSVVQTLPRAHFHTFVTAFTPSLYLVTLFTELHHIVTFCHPIFEMFRTSRFAIDRFALAFILAMLLLLLSTQHPMNQLPRLFIVDFHQLPLPILLLFTFLFRIIPQLELQ